MNELSDRPSTVAKEQQKKIYRTPNLACYGPVERLTQGIGSLAADGGSGGRAKK